MASFLLVGVIDGIKYLPNGGGCMVFMSEFRRGYKKSDGVVVEDKYLSWRILFKQGLVNYINNHFNRGMVVEVKGDVLPYSVVHGDVVDGYTVLGQTMNMYSIPRLSGRMESRMVKQSELHPSGVPDLEGYMESDFD